MKKQNISTSRKKLGFLFVALVVLLLSSTAVNANTPAKKNKVSNSPVFSDFSYQGQDSIYIKNPLTDNEMYNPILQGCYPDPAITRKGDDYYMVCSSFAMFPGVPIFHSKDLVNWTSLGGVLNNVNTFNPHNTGISGGVYAPGITYNPNNDTFYMIVTAFAGGLGNIIVKTKDPMKGWGDPIKLKFNGIDPSIFFDDDGKGYIVHNDAPDRGTEQYQGHRVIKIWEYDVENDQVIEGTDKIIVNGGVDITKKPIWIEAPHLYKKDGSYYLMCAEGGTGDWHSEVIFKSDSPKGPFIPAANNPILTQRYFAKDRKNKVDWAGHADLVSTPDGKYYGVFLAVRPNEEGRVNTGRETFMLPVDWSGTFPVFENGLIPIEPKLKLPEGTENKRGENGFHPNGNFTFKDDFSADQLDYSWIGLRGPREAFVKNTENGIQLTPFEANIKEVKPTSTLFYRQQHNSFTYAVSMSYQPESEKDMAGVVALQSESSNYVFAITKKGDDSYLVLARNSRKSRWSRSVDTEIKASVKVDAGKPIRLKIAAQGDQYTFSYATDGSNFTVLGGIVSGDILSTDVAGGFTGCILGLYATSANDILPE